MGSEWEHVGLADTIEIVSGGTPKTSIAEYWGGDIPWLSVADFNTGYRWVSSAEKTITARGLSESATTILDRGDIIISARGTVGVVAQLARPMAFNQSCYGIRGKQDVADTSFIYYLLKNSVAGMKQVAHGGVFDTITRDTFGIIEVLLPPLPEQRAIAAILGALDDKIELNRRTNETLEGIARAIFRSWFVDFDPVRVNAARKGRRERGQPALPGLLGPAIPDAVLALFPDGFEESELGEIPRGWGVQSLLNRAQVIGGGTPKTSIAEYWGGKIPWYSVADTPRRGDVFVIQTEKSITEAGAENSSTRILPIGTTVISARGTVGNLALVGVPMAMNQSCYGLQDPRSDCGYYVYFSTAAAVGTLQQRTHGSVFSTITRDTLDSVAVVDPPDGVVEQFESSVDPMLRRILSNLYETRTLAALRDILLPKLISGELRVRDAERIVGRCV